MSFGLLSWEWLAVLGPVAIAIAIAYAMMRNHRRTAADRAASERGAQKLYERED